MNANSFIASIADVNKFITDLNEVLTADNYELDILHRKKDEDPTDPFQDRPPFWVFGKVIQNREIYIKVKIRNRKTNKVFCVSFHFARHPFKAMPY